MSHNTAICNWGWGGGGGVGHSRHGGMVPKRNIFDIHHTWSVYLLKGESFPLYPNLEVI